VADNLGTLVSVVRRRVDIEENDGSNIMYLPSPADYKGSFSKEQF